FALWLGLERSRRARRRQVALKTKSEKYARKPRGSTPHCNRDRLRALFLRFHTTKTLKRLRPDSSIAPQHEDGMSRSRTVREAQWLPPAVYSVQRAAKLVPDAGRCEIYE